MDIYNYRKNMVKMFKLSTFYAVTLLIRERFKGQLCESGMPTFRCMKVTKKYKDIFLNYIFLFPRREGR